MKINRTQDVHNVPDWVTAGTHLEAIERNAELLRAGIDRLNVTATSEVNDMCLFEECDQIEKCASSGETYYYNSTWSPDHVGHLREFASVVGLPLDKIIGVDPTSVINREASSDQMVKTASAEPQESTMEVALKDALGDPFKLDERSNMDHMKQANWEQIAPEAKLKDSPDIAMMGGIMPLRGGEDYRIANQPGLASNQNSIADPGALDRLWNSEEESSGERLARQAREREEAKKSKHEEWQAEKVAQMQADGFEAKGVVFPTEVGNVGSGISSSFMGAYSEADLQNLPEKTAGEQLASAAENRRASIQRDVKAEEEKKDWDRIKEAPSRMVSDHFTDELKKRLG
jgi:hypothetical protein